MKLTIQDLLAILGPVTALVGFLWYHFNIRIDKLENKIDLVESKLESKMDSIEVKIDAVRDRVSRIEGQLIPTKIISFEDIRNREAT